MTVSSVKRILVALVAVLFLASPVSAQVATGPAQNYVTGTFTPGMTINASATGIAFSTQVGYYTQIGNIVHADMTILLSSKGASTGNVLITGLPVMSVTATAYHASCTVQPYNTVTTNYIFGDVPSGSTTLTLFNHVAGASSTLTNTNLNNTSQFNITCVYESP